MLGINNKSEHKPRLHRDKNNSRGENEAKQKKQIERLKRKPRVKENKLDRK